MVIGNSWILNECGIAVSTLPGTVWVQCTIDLPSFKRYTILIIEDIFDMWCNFCFCSFLGTVIEHALFCYLNHHIIYLSWSYLFWWPHIALLMILEFHFFSQVNSAAGFLFACYVLSVFISAVSSLVDTDAALGSWENLFNQIEWTSMRAHILFCCCLFAFITNWFLTFFPPLIMVLQAYFYVKERFLQLRIGRW